MGRALHQIFLPDSSGHVRILRTRQLWILQTTYYVGAARTLAEIR